MNRKLSYIYNVSKKVAVHSVLDTRLYIEIKKKEQFLGAEEWC